MLERSETPIKYCEWCGEQFFKRKKSTNKRFLATRFCGFKCSAQHVGAEITRKARERNLLELTEKQCRMCKQIKNIAEFPKKGKTRAGNVRYSYCRPCHAGYQREHRLKQQFSLTSLEYEEISIYQQGLCAVCLKPPKKVNLAVDHNHKTGLVRGLLCPMCNRTAGLFKDDIDRFARLVDYMRNPPAVKALGEERFGRLGKTRIRELRPQTTKYILN